MLSEPGQPLAAVYEGRSPADPWPLFRRLCSDRRARLLETMGRWRIQTNEVGRSSLLGPALAWASGRLEAPLCLIDAGCSGGLNLLLDRYRLDYGPCGTTGPADSPVRLRCTVSGGDPPIRPRLPEIGRRLGIDIDSPDLGSPEDVRWLLACCRPGTGRIEHARAAIELARRHPPEVRRGDAVGTLPAVLAATAPEPGVRCVVTTWAYSYLSATDRQPFLDLLADAGGRRPVMWIAAEVVGAVDLERFGAPSHLGGAPAGRRERERTTSTPSPPWSSAPRAPRAGGWRRCRRTGSGWTGATSHFWRVRPAVPGGGGASSTRPSRSTETGPSSLTTITVAVGLSWL